ncbi:hypothetical protein E8E12_008057 [Didymella heteroderae]|uniref:Heterokaryon incompatibility domain-containing protein n=1 Tax=Didymella heteroderae TaxID=1769908 RepID=A0A9P5C3F9_9PLEO|nr:hypothetical protein E8E12_008057 [Didymella heteroderae]
MILIDTRTLKLTRFDDEAQIPRYAVLSHTWGGWEVTYEEFSAQQDLLDYAKNRMEKGPGFEKIRLVCRQAFNDKIDYVWVDTCCIDKRSSAELSEAINSMFRWYRKAAVCYAYLDDVEGGEPFSPIGTKENEPEEPDAVWIYDQEAVRQYALKKERLRKARWFSRGWTLQELIAPSQVLFYGKQWSFLGTKTTLCELLSLITGIDEAALQGANLEAFSVARRMSWAADRVTTRTEDLAYSLLGLFDVNMPLLYGEGEKAFTRLQEEIMKDSSDESLFAWTPTSVMPSISIMPSEQWRPVFASHPMEFATTMLMPLQREVDDFSMTNQGVKINVPILPFDEEINRDAANPFDRKHYKRSSFSGEQQLFIVVLNCTFDMHGSPAELDFRVGIVCQRVNDAGWQLVRHCSAALVPVSLDDFAKAQRLNVYLLKKIPASLLEYDLRPSTSLQRAWRDLEQTLNELSMPSS